jgi:hypothetical protein
MKHRIYEATYYYIERDFEEMDIQDIENNDANGICWVKVGCLSHLELNSHCKKLLDKFLN